MPDAAQYLRSLEMANSLREPVIREAVESLKIPQGSFGLDVGCGIGLYTLLLAELVGDGGHVTGLDLSNEFLSRARYLGLESSVANRVSFKEGDAGKLPFHEKTFDWACSMDFAGYAPLDPVMLLKEMRRVVKPGGRVFILMWSSQQLLPGYPMLEARLNATSSGIAPFTAVMNPESHMMRALGWFGKAGLIEAKARTFVRNICPPLSFEAKNALIDLFQMRWGQAESEVAPEIWEEYQRLCLPDSPDLVFNIPEYYGFFTYTMFYGNVV